MNNKKLDFNKMWYNLKEFFNDRDDKTKMECTFANDYSPFHSGTRRWETVTKLIMTNNNYSERIQDKRKETNFELIKNYPFVYKAKKADLEKNM